MARVKRGKNVRRKHNKLLELTRGYRGTNSRLIRRAKEASLHAGEYAFAGRKDRKGDFRQLWILRINQAVRTLGINYRDFTHLLKSKNINLDRKMLANLVVSDFETFKKVVEKARTK